MTPHALQRFREVPPPQSQPEAIAPIVEQAPYAIAPPLSYTPGFLCQSESQDAHLTEPSLFSQRPRAGTPVTNQPIVFGVWLPLDRSLAEQWWAGTGVPVGAR